MPPPITSASTLLTRFSSRSILVETLAPPMIAITGLGRRFQRLAKRVEFGLHGAPGIGRQLVAEALGRGVRAVRGRKGVVDVDIAEPGQFGDEGRIVLFLFLMEAGIFQAKDVAILHRANCLFSDVADAIVCECHRLPDHLRQCGRDGFQRVLGVASLRPAEMRQQDHFAALAGYLGDGSGDAFEPRGVGDPSIFHRHVEIDAQQDALALYVDIIEGAECLGH